MENNKSIIDKINNEIINYLTHYLYSITLQKAEFPSSDTELYEMASKVNLEPFKHIADFVATLILVDDLRDNWKKTLAFIAVNNGLKNLNSFTIRNDNDKEVN